jgi:hypothetical protein
MFDTKFLGHFLRFVVVAGSGWSRIAEISLVTNLQKILVLLLDTNLYSPLHFFLPR